MESRVPVLPDDDPDSLAARVFEQELVLLPSVIREIAAGAVRFESGRVVRNS